MSTSCSSPWTKSSHIYHYTCHICKDTTSYLPPPLLQVLWLKAGHCFIMCTQLQSQMTWQKGKKRELKTVWWQRDRGGASPEASPESMTDYIAKGLAEMLQPYSKNLSGNGPGVYVALNLKMWSGHWCQLWEGCGKSCIATSPLFWVSIPWFSILIYPNYSLSHWSCFIPLSIEETYHRHFWARLPIHSWPWNLTARCARKWSAGVWDRWSSITHLETLFLFPSVFSRLMPVRAVPRHNAENTSGKKILLQT